MQAKNRFEVKTKSSGSGENHSEGYSNTGQVPARTSQAKAKLPKLTLSKFRGEFTKWNTFWYSFQSAVHDNPEISQVVQLISQLSVSGTGGKSHFWLNIDCFELREHRANSSGSLRQNTADYHRAYGRIQLIKITPCHNDRPTSLRYVFDQISVHTRGLASLDVFPEQYGSLLISIIMSKLPNKIRLHVARNSTDEVWTND